VRRPGFGRLPGHVISSTDRLGGLCSHGKKDVTLFPSFSLLGGMVLDKTHLDTDPKPT